MATSNYTKPAGVQDYLIILSNRGRAILMTMTLTLIVFAVYAWTRPDRYKATNNIEVKVRSEEPLRQPLTKTTSFLRRFATMKKRIVSLTGLRRMAADSDILMTNASIRVKKILNNLKKLDWYVKKDREDIEKAMASKDITEEYREQLRGELEKASIKADYVEKTIRDPQERLESVDKALSGEESRLITDEMIAQIEANLTAIENDPALSENDRKRSGTLVEHWRSALPKIDMRNKLYRHKHEDKTLQISEKDIEDYRRIWSHDAIELAETLKALEKDLDINISANVITIAFVSENAVVATRVVDSMVFLFRLENLALQKEEIQAAVDVYTGEVERFKVKVAKARQELIAAGTRYPEEFLSNPTEPDSIAKTTVVVDREDRAVERLIALQNKLLFIDSEIADTNRRIENFRSELKSIPEYVRLSEIYKQNPSYLMIANKIAVLDAELAEIRADSTEIHPLIQEKENRLKALQDSLVRVPKLEKEEVKEEKNPIRGHLDLQIAELDAKSKGLSSQRAIILKELEWLQRDMKNMPQTVIELDAKRREYFTLLGTLQTYQDNLKNAELTKRLELDKEGTVFDVRDKAAVPNKPFSPNRLLIMFMGILIGCLLSVTMVFFLEYVDHSIKDIGDAKRYLDMPVLGAISMLSLQEKEQHRKRRTDPFAELNLSQNPTEEEKKTFWERYDKVKKKRK